MLLLLRSGHCDYRMSRISNGNHSAGIINCSICGYLDDMEHRLIECTSVVLARLRRQMQTVVRGLHQQIQDDLSLKPERWDIQDVEYDDLEVYLFPDTRFPMEFRIKIIKESIRFGSYCFYYGGE